MAFVSTTTFRNLLVYVQEIILTHSPSSSLCIPVQRHIQLPVSNVSNCPEQIISMKKKPNKDDSFTLKLHIYYQLNFYIYTSVSVLILSPSKDQTGLQSKGHYKIRGDSCTRRFELRKLKRATRDEALVVVTICCFTLQRSLQSKYSRFK